MIYFYIIMAIGVLSILYYFYRGHMRLKNMTIGVELVYRGVAIYLLRRFKPKYGEEIAGWLSAAVTNELFSRSPSNPDAKIFLESHKEIIEQELSNIQNDEIRDIVTQAIGFQAIISYSKGKRTKESMFDPIIKLKKFGITIPERELPPPGRFLGMACDFYESIEKENSNASDSEKT